MMSYIKRIDITVYMIHVRTMARVPQLMKSVTRKLGIGVRKDSVFPLPSLCPVPGRGMTRIQDSQFPARYMAKRGTHTALLKGYVFPIALHIILLMYRGKTVK